MRTLHLVSHTHWDREKSFARAARVTLAEEKREELPMASDGSITCPARGHEVVTVKLTNARRTTRARSTPFPTGLADFPPARD